MHVSSDTRRSIWIALPSCTKRLSGNLLVEVERPLSLRFNPEIDIRSHNPDRATEIDIAGTRGPARISLKPFFDPERSRILC